MFPPKELLHIPPMMKMMNMHIYFNPNYQKSNLCTQIMWHPFEEEHVDFLRIHSHCKIYYYHFLCSMAVLEHTNSKLELTNSQESILGKSHIDISFVTLTANNYMAAINKKAKRRT